MAAPSLLRKRRSQVRSKAHIKLSVGKMCKIARVAITVSYMTRITNRGTMTHGDTLRADPLDPFRSERVL